MIYTIIVSILLCSIAYLSISYLIQQKKKGHTCIGCPNSKTCNKHTVCI